MSETDKLTHRQQDTALWEGLNQFSTLPDWLVAARNPTLIMDSLYHLVPEFSSGQLNLNMVDVGNVRYKNEFWTGHYDLHVDSPTQNGAEQQVIQLQGTISPPNLMVGRRSSVEGKIGGKEWRAIIPDLCLELKPREAEQVLTGLEELTDPDRSREYLANSIRAAGNPRFCDLNIWASNPRVVRYKPGSRCTVVYHLEYEPDLARDHDWPDIVVAKTYRGEKGHNAYDSMLALWNSPLGSSRTVKVAEPLAYDPERRILIQGPIYEDLTLKDLVHQAIRTRDPQTIEQLKRYMRMTAVALSELHLSNVRMGILWQWKDEMGEVYRWINRLSNSLPEFAQAIQPFIHRLEEMEAASPPDPFVPSHGSFRPAQVLIYKGEIGFIDFDSFCQSEPANDLGLFLAAVMSMGLTTPAVEDDDSSIPSDAATRQARYELVRDISEELLLEYQRYIPVSRQRVALWIAMDIFMLVIHSWTKIKVNNLANVFEVLERFIQDHQIAEG